MKFKGRGNNMWTTIVEEEGKMLKPIKRQRKKNKTPQIIYVKKKDIDPEELVQFHNPTLLNFNQEGEKSEKTPKKAEPKLCGSKSPLSKRLN